MTLFAPIYYFYIGLNLTISAFLLVFGICCGAQEYTKKCFFAFGLGVLVLGSIWAEPKFTSPFEPRIVLPALLLLVCQMHLAIEMRRA